MKVLVTGGAGFIGSHLCEELLNSRWIEISEVVAVDNLQTGSLHNIKNIISDKSFKIHFFNVRDLESLSKIAVGCDYIFHLAATVGVKNVLRNITACVNNNILGTERVIDVALRNNAKLFFASTSSVYGSYSAEAAENHRVILGKSGVWAYAASKIIGEYLVRWAYETYGLDVVIGRLFNVIGPRQGLSTGHVLPKFINNAMKGLPLIIHGTGEQKRSFIWVEDAARIIAYLTLSDKTSGMVFNIASGAEPITMRELAEKVIKITKSKSKIIEMPLEAAYGEGYEDVSVRSANISLLKKYFPRFEPGKNIDKMIKEIVRLGWGKDVKASN